MDIEFYKEIIAEEKELEAKINKVKREKSNLIQQETLKIKSLIKDKLVFNNINLASVESSYVYSNSNSFDIICDVTPEFITILENISLDNDINKRFKHFVKIRFNWDFIAKKFKIYLQYEFNDSFFRIKKSKKKKEKDSYNKPNKNIDLESTTNVWLRDFIIKIENYKKNQNIDELISNIKIHFDSFELYYVSEKLISSGE